MVRTIDFFEVVDTAEVPRPSKPGKADQRIAEYVRTRQYSPPPDLILEWRRQERRSRTHRRRLASLAAVLTGTGLVVVLWPLLLGLFMTNG